VKYMIGESITCEHLGCNVVFVKKTHNQRYHDDECCRLATNAKIMEKYYAKRAQRLGLARWCEECSSPLSRYNSDTVCNACTVSKQKSRKLEVEFMLASVVLA